MAFVVDKKLIQAVGLSIVLSVVFCANLIQVSIPGVQELVPTFRFLPLCAASLAALSLPETLRWLTYRRAGRVIMLRVGAALILAAVPATVTGLLVVRDDAIATIAAQLTISAITYAVGASRPRMAWIPAMALATIYLFVPVASGGLLSSPDVLIGAAALLVVAVTIQACSLPRGSSEA